MTSRKSLGSMRAESAVEPTRSENISDLTALGGVDGRARGYSTRRGPRRLCTRAKHSNSFQELESSPKRNTDLAQMILRQIVQNRFVDGFSRNAASYCSRPRLRSQPPRSMKTP